MENKTVEESVMTAMECGDVALVKHLPYILQDWWEIGTSSGEVIKIIRKHKTDYANLKLLDLGSGKGAVSIKAAAELKCKCLGIDAIDEFVAFSNEKAKEFSVSDICTFETDDIRKKIKTLGKFDIIVLGAIGPVFGDYFTTLSQLKPLLNKDGLIIIDDAYSDDNCDETYPNILQKSELLRQINAAEMNLIDEITVAEIPETLDKYESECANIQKRCAELAEKFPADRKLFSDYAENQVREYEILSNEITCALVVVGQKKMKRGRISTPC